MEVAEGLPPHEIGGVDGQPVVLCAHRLPGAGSWSACAAAARGEARPSALVGAGSEVVDHRGEDVHAVHETERAPAHLQALLARLHPTAVRQIREARVADHVARVNDHEAAGVPLVRSSRSSGPLSEAALLLEI